MKQCPKCGTTYTDETLRYCLNDGADLSENDEQATLVRTAAGQQNIKTAAYSHGGQLRVDIPQTTTTPAFAATPPPGSTPTNWLKIGAVVGVLGIMVLAAGGIAGALIYFNKDARTAVTNNGNNPTNRSTPLPTSTPTALPTVANVANNDTNQLRDQIANLEKRLNEQNNANRSTANVPPVSPDQPTTSRTTASVNSPGDGFLAMRTLPSSDIGERVLAIPNGARISVNGCLGRSRVGNKTGRWCRTSYGGYTGWVFDAWLVY